MARTLPLKKKKKQKEYIPTTELSPEGLPKPKTEQDVQEFQQAQQSREQLGSTGITVGALRAAMNPQGVVDTSKLRRQGYSYYQIKEAQRAYSASGYDKPTKYISSKALSEKAGIEARRRQEARKAPVIEKVPPSEYIPSRLLLQWQRGADVRWAAQQYKRKATAKEVLYRTRSEYGYGAPLAYARSEALQTSPTARAVEAETARIKTVTYPGAVSSEQVLESVQEPEYFKPVGGELTVAPAPTLGEKSERYFTKGGEEGYVAGILYGAGSGVKKLGQSFIQRPIKSTAFAATAILAPPVAGMWFAGETVYTFSKTGMYADIIPKTPTEAAELGGQVLAFGAVTGGVRAGLKRTGYMPRLTYESFDVGGKTQWKGVGVEMGSRGRPLVGRAGGKWKLGTPRMKIKSSQLKGGMVVESPVQTRIFEKGLEQTYKPTELKKFSLGREVMKATETTKSAFIQKKPFTETKTLSSKGVKQVLKATKKAKGDIYGSYAARQQMPSSKSIPSDIDVQLRFGQAESQMFTKQLVKKLGKTDVVRVSSQSPTLIEAKVGGKWHHAVDIHSIEMAIKDVASPAVAGERIYGFKLGQDPIKIQGTRYMPLSEQGLRKGASIFTATESGFAPKAHRMKDIAHFFETQEVLLASKTIPNIRGQLALAELKGMYPAELFGEVPTVKVPLYQSSITGAARTPPGFSSFGFMPRSPSRGMSVSIAPSSYGFVSPSISPSTSLSKSISASISPRISSFSKSISPSRSRSISRSISRSRPTSPSRSRPFSPSKSISSSVSRSISPSASRSISPSPSPSKPFKTSPSIYSIPTRKRKPRPKIPPQDLRFGWKFSRPKRRKKRKTKPAFYKPSLYGADIFKEEGLTIGKEPKWTAGIGLREVTKGQARRAKQSMKGWSI